MIKSIKNIKCKCNYLIGIYKNSLYYVGNIHSFITIFTFSQYSFLLKSKINIFALFYIISIIFY